MRYRKAITLSIAFLLPFAQLSAMAQNLTPRSHTVLAQEALKSLAPLFSKKMSFGELITAVDRKVPAELQTFLKSKEGVASHPVHLRSITATEFAASSGDHRLYIEIINPLRREFKINGQPMIVDFTADYGRLLKQVVERLERPATKKSALWMNLLLPRAEAFLGLDTTTWVVGGAALLGLFALYNYANCNRYEDYARQCVSGAYAYQPATFLAEVTAFDSNPLYPAWFCSSKETLRQCVANLQANLNYGQAGGFQSFDQPVQRQSPRVLDMAPVKKISIRRMPKITDSAPTRGAANDAGKIVIERPSSSGMK